MEGIIVCFIGDYAICKNEESGEVFNVSKNSIKRCHVGDIIINKEEIWIKKKKEKANKKNSKFEDCYICDDIVIEINK